MKLLRLILPCFHYNLAFCLLVYVIYAHYTAVTGHVKAFDFYAYFHAAQLAMTSPSLLYHFDAYPAPDSPTQAFLPFLNPPTFLPLIYLLGFFSYLNAYILWTVVNLGLSFLIWKKMQKLCSELDPGQYKNLMTSLVFALPAWAYCIYVGQVSILLGLATISFLLGAREKEDQKASCWLAIALAIKPHLFLPVLLFVAGLRNYRLVAYTIAWEVLLIILSIFLVGYPAWPEFFAALLHPHAVTGANIADMINLRGLFATNSEVFFTLYGLVCIAAFALGIYQSKKNPEATYPLVFISAFFFAPWLHFQDSYALLFVIPLMLHALKDSQRIWLLPIYLFAVFGLFISGYVDLPHIYRAILLLLWAISLYIFRKSAEESLT